MLLRLLVLVIGLLFPGTMYGISVHLPVQIVPVNQNNQPSPPQQAAVANFNTCVVCIDFAATTGGVFVNGKAVAGKNGADASTWLDCAGSGSPIWYKGTNQPQHSSDYLCPDITNDGAGNSHVLRLTMGPQATWSVGTGALLWNGSSGIMAPTNLYVEAVLWYSAWPPAFGYGTSVWMGGAGQIPANLHNYLEYDSHEINAGSGGCCSGAGMSSNWHNWHNNHYTFASNWFGTFPPNYNGYNPTSGYHTIGMRITSNGTNLIYKCMWLDGIFQSCENASPDATNFVASQLSDATSRMQVYLTGPANFFGATTSSMTTYYKSLNIMSCINWQTTACSTPGNPDPGGY